MRDCPNCGNAVSEMAPDYGKCSKCKRFVN